MKTILAALLTASLAAGAQAASLTDRYSSFVVFGDSLSDGGNLFAATAGAPLRIPGAPYVNGRFSNGPIWADALAAEFAAAGRPTANFAFGLANAASDSAVPDLPEQLGLFALLAAGLPAGALGLNPLAALWFGANDVFGAVDGGADAAGAAAVGRAAAQAVGMGAQALAAAGFGAVALFNLPDLGLTPAYATLAPALADEATAGSDAFNAELAAQAAALRAGGLGVTEVDIAGLFDALLADPTDFGLTDATTACYPGDAVPVMTGQVPGCDADTLKGLAFFDAVHPTAAVHAAIADGARAALVPLPAGLPLLALGLGALALLRRRAA